MLSRFTRSLFLKILTTGLAIAYLAPVTVAQLEEVRSVADPRDGRFAGVTEEFTSPSLDGSHLRPVAPLGGFIDDTHPGYTVQLLQLQWRFGDPLDVYVIKPTGIKKPPVILNLYGYPADTDPYKVEIFQKALTEQGFAAVGFVSALTGHRYHDRPMKAWFLSELQESLATSAHDVQMVLDYLAARGDLDMTRVGMFGQGTGATIAILTSAVDPRIKVLDVLDPWGDWPTWMATSPVVPEDERPDYKKPEFLKKAGALETLNWFPKVKAKKVRLQQNLFETDTPKGVKDKLRAAIPSGAEVVLYKAPEDFNAAFPHSTNLEWMKSELGTQPGKAVAMKRRN